MPQGGAPLKAKHRMNKDLTVHAQQLNEDAAQEAEKFREGELTDHHENKCLKTLLFTGEIACWQK